MLLYNFITMDFPSLPWSLFSPFCSSSQATYFLPSGFHTIEIFSSFCFSLTFILFEGKFLKARIPLNSWDSHSNIRTRNQNSNPLIPPLLHLFFSFFHSPAILAFFAFAYSYSFLKLIILKYYHQPWLPFSLSFSDMTWLLDLSLNYIFLL